MGRKFHVNWIDGFGPWWPYHTEGDQDVWSCCSCSQMLKIDVERYWAQQQALGQAPAAQLPPQMMVQGCEWFFSINPECWSWNSLRHVSQFEEFEQWRVFLHASDKIFCCCFQRCFWGRCKSKSPSCRLSSTIYHIYIYTPFFKDVLVHPEITVRHMLRLSWQW